MSLELAAFRQYIDSFAMHHSERIMLREFAIDWEANLKQIPEKDVLKARREDIAKHALAGLLSNNSIISNNHTLMNIPKIALDHADTLIKELDK